MKQYPVQPQRVRWAMAQLQQAGIQAQLQRTATGYVIVVADDADEHAAPVVGGVIGYQAHGRKPRRKRHGWRRLAAVWGWVLAFVVVGFFVYASSDQAPFPNTVHTGSALYEWTTFDLSDPYLRYMLIAMGIVGAGMLTLVWFSQAPKAHPEWNGTSTGAALLAVVVFVAGVTMLAYLIHSGQAGALTQIYRALGARP